MVWIAQINSGYTLAKRVAINRGVDYQKIKSSLLENVNISACKKGGIFAGSIGFDVFGDQILTNTNNLKTYTNVPKNV